MQELQVKSKLFTSELNNFQREHSKILEAIKTLESQLDSMQSRRDKSINNNPLADMGDGRYKTRARLLMRPYSRELEELKTREHFFRCSFSSRLYDVSEVLTAWYFSTDSNTSCPVNPFKI